MTRLSFVLRESRMSNGLKSALRRHDAVQVGLRSMRTLAMDLQRDGCLMLPSILSQGRCESVGRELQAAFRQEMGGAIETRRGGIVGGRNLLEWWDGWRDITDHPVVADVILNHVGPAAGLVRILYFDKPPGQSWSLSLHRDKTIAVAEHHRPADPFSKPTRKLGVPHVEATTELLERMLTLRLHLDPMCEENGPLVISSGSHRDFSENRREEITPVHCEVGDLFVMRPLLLHGSRASHPETQLHRRVVHLELAPSAALPSPYRWHRFQRVAVSQASPE